MNQQPFNRPGLSRSQGNTTSPPPESEKKKGRFWLWLGLGLGGVALVGVVIIALVAVLVVGSVQEGQRIADLNEAIESQNWGAVLELDPNNTDALNHLAQDCIDRVNPDTDLAFELLSRSEALNGQNDLYQQVYIRALLYRARDQVTQDLAAALTDYEDAKTRLASNAGTGQITALLESTCEEICRQYDSMLSKQLDAKDREQAKVTLRALKSIAPNRDLGSRYAFFEFVEDQQTFLASPSQDLWIALVEGHKSLLSSVTPNTAWINEVQDFEAALLDKSADCIEDDVELAFSMHQFLAGLPRELDTNTLSEALQIHLVDQAAGQLNQRDLVGFVSTLKMLQVLDVKSVLDLQKEGLTQQKTAAEVRAYFGALEKEGVNSSAMLADYSQLRVVEASNEQLEPVVTSATFKLEDIEWKKLHGRRVIFDCQVPFQTPLQQPLNVDLLYGYVSESIKTWQAEANEVLSVLKKDDLPALLTFVTDDEKNEIFDGMKASGVIKESATQEQLDKAKTASGLAGRLWQIHFYDQMKNEWISLETAASASENSAGVNSRARESMSWVNALGLVLLNHPDAKEIQLQLDSLVEAVTACSDEMTRIDEAAGKNKEIEHVEMQLVLGYEALGRFLWLYEISQLASGNRITNGHDFIRGMGTNSVTFTPLRVQGGEELLRQAKDWVMSGGADSGGDSDKLGDPNQLWMLCAQHLNVSGQLFFDPFGKYPGVVFVVDRILVTRPAQAGASSVDPVLPGFVVSEDTSFTLPIHDVPLGISLGGVHPAASILGGADGQLWPGDNDDTDKSNSTQAQP